jgi:hypothetical protein
MKASRAVLFGAAVAASLLAQVAAPALGFGASSTAANEPPVSLAPADGGVFAWEDVQSFGVPLVVQAPAGLGLVSAEVARDPGLREGADLVVLDEASPGRYEGTALTLLFDEDTDPGVYYWRPYYDGALDPDTGELARVVGQVRSLRVEIPYAAPSLSVSLPGTLLAGEQYRARLRYRPGSEPSSDRLYLLESRLPCPHAPSSGAGRVRLDTAAPPASGQLDVPLRPRRLGRLRLCAYVTSGGAVTRRAADSADVVRRPASRARMLRWHLTAGGLGPLRIGMTVRELERATGRTMIFSYGEYRACELWYLRGAPRGLSLMIAYGRLARVEAYRGRWRSARGVSIGDTERKVRRRYRGVRSEPHPYVPPGKYLIVGGRGRRMIFETGPNGRVTSFRGGRAREVGYIEGCV